MKKFELPTKIIEKGKLAGSLKSGPNKCTVLIFKTVRQMRAYLVSIGYPKNEVKSGLGQCSMMKKFDYSIKPYKQKYAWEITLCEQCLGAGYVAHELAHLVLQLFSLRKEKKIYAGCKEEELFAMVFGWLNSHFWVRYERSCKSKPA